MSIKPSAASDIRTLIHSLGGDDEIRREAAIARLAIIGGRAIGRLVSEYQAAEGDWSKRVAILRVFEAAGDARAVPVARQALTEQADVAVAATLVLQAFLESVTDGAAAEALDALVTTALDRQAERRVRLAALDALQGMPEEVRSRVAAAIADDPDPALQARAAAAPTGGTAADAIWQDAIDGKLPDRAAHLRDAMQTRAASASLIALQRLIDASHQREAEVSAAQSHEWRSARGALHQALALRGSRIAVYDLRESIAAAAEPLPTTFLTALHVVGDESCLEAIAAAYDTAATLAHGRPVAADDTSSEANLQLWLQQLTAAFQAIVKREKVARKAATMTRIANKWPAAARVLSKTSRTTPRPKTRART
jgi:hypothetical protein